MKIVAQMMCRNEADVIRETVSEILRWVDTLVVLDGGSTDGTYGKLLRLAGEQAIKGKQIEVHCEPDPGDTFADHTRNRLLELTAPHKPDWVISVDADEIYHCDHNLNGPYVLDAIHAAERAGANVVRSNVPQFWLTFDDLRRGLLNEDESIPVQKRRRWYSWGHMGTFIWKWNDDHYYPQDTPKRTPELPGLTWRQWQRAGPYMPICKHYCFRSLRQALKRTDERLVRGGRKYFGKYATNWLIDEQLVGLHHLGAHESWVTAENHLFVGRYMAGEHIE
jgi:glycosyltransferase involved in cell wall biosynthesis